MFTANDQAKTPRWLPATAIIFFINALLLGAAYFGFEYVYKDKIYPDVFVGNINLGGKTSDEAKGLLEKRVDRIVNDGIIFSYGNNDMTLSPVMSSLDADIAHQIITFNTDDALKNALAYGRDGDFLDNLKNKMNLLIFRVELKANVGIDEEKVKQLLKDNFSIAEIPAENADLIYHDASAGRSALKKFSVAKESIGMSINYDRGINALKAKLSRLDNSKILLVAEKNYPQIFEKDVLNIDRTASALVGKAPFSLTGKDNRWKVGQAEFASWLHLELSPEPGATSSSQNKIIVALNPVVVKQYLTDKIALMINKKPVDAKFQIIKGKITKFQSSSDGMELDVDATFDAINHDLFHGTSTEVAIITKSTKSSVGLDEVNNLGIKEIIGTGQSNFSGSPVNRRHNIKVGADAVNGTLVKPDENFSLLKTLGEIDASTGYLPELVIKQNKTTPEFGGGLCQIGTTVFRGALSSGLPITQRQNHSYRVSYYEPAGTDATIYNPWPDFRFINDTGNYILIQSRIEGNNLYFDFWGTKDGRLVEQTKSTIYNIVKPKPAKIIETLDLKPGEKKCTEKAHNGADAYFNYKVTYQNGDIKEKKFNSHYVPWQEVCLLGVKELSATSTPSLIDPGAGSATLKQQ